MDIKLRCGRTISLIQLQQSRTHYGFLAGPVARIKGRHIAEVLDEARALWPHGPEPFLLSPAAGDELPRVTCIGTFDSDGLVQRGSGPNSSLTVVWFQDEFGVPQRGRVLEQIAALDWETLAMDWSW